MTRSVTTIRSPKRGAVGHQSRSEWFPYYAGFSSAFVQDVLHHLNLPPDATILDPWLGAGTTAEVAAQGRYRFRGYDLNPAMVLVARARTLATGHLPQVSALANSIKQSYSRSKSDTRSGGFVDDPLHQWLTEHSARDLRSLQRCVSSLAGGASEAAGPLWKNVRRATPIHAFFYVALFRTLRHFLKRFQGSNPAWIKLPESRSRIAPTPDSLFTRFMAEVHALIECVRSEAHIVPVRARSACRLDQASSLQLPIPSASIDALIGSPPYCTRIDYVRATLPELAIIGYPHGAAIRRLRAQMIGTPTIARPQLQISRAWGGTCRKFLAAVARHPSKASSTYYLTYYLQYFTAAHDSLREVTRTLKATGRCVLVVQDSYYKEIRNDLPQVFIEMAQHFDWRLEERRDFRTRNTLAGVNPRVRRYRRRFQATESVLVFARR